MSDLLSAPRGELLKLIYELIEANQALKAQVAELREEDQKLKDGFKGKQGKNPPLFVKPSVKRKKSKGKSKKDY